MARKKKPKAKWDGREWLVPDWCEKCKDWHFLGCPDDINKYISGRKKKRVVWVGEHSGNLCAYGFTRKQLIRRGYKPVKFVEA